MTSLTYLFVLLIFVLLQNIHGFQYTDDFTSTLPVFLLNANVPIPATEDNIVNMTVIYEGDKDYFNGLAEIAIHGASSRTYQQKSMSLKSLHFDGSNDNFPFFGFPKGKRWLLINHFNDKSLMRNALSFELFSSLGRYAPRYKYCEVFLNNEYAGIYLFVEKITQDKNRVNIKEIDEDDLSGNDLTGGYIWKYEVYSGYEAHYPSKSDIQPNQSNYLFNEFVPATFNKLWTANDTERAELIDEHSFIDYFLHSELSANVDGFKKSRYFYKDRDDVDPRIHAGPVWDFDWAWKFIPENPLPISSGHSWIHEYIDPCCSGHSFSTLFNQSELYRNMTIKKWFEYRENVYSHDNIVSIVDNFYQLLNSSGAVQRHFSTYYLLGYPSNAPEIFVPLATTYEGEVLNLKFFISFRLKFMDDNIKYITNSTVIFEEDAIIDSPAFNLSPIFSVFVISLLISLFIGNL